MANGGRILSDLMVGGAVGSRSFVTPSGGRPARIAEMRSSSWTSSWRRVRRYGNALAGGASTPVAVSNCSHSAFEARVSFRCNCQHARSDAGRSGEPVSPNGGPAMGLSAVESIFSGARKSSHASVFTLNMSAKDRWRRYPFVRRTIGSSEAPVRKAWPRLTSSKRYRRSLSAARRLDPGCSI
jgi:hypothetical protein